MYRETGREVSREKETKIYIMKRKWEIILRIDIDIDILNKSEGRVNVSYGIWSFSKQSLSRLSLNSFVVIVVSIEMNFFGVKTF